MDRKEIQRELCQRSFYSFVKLAFPVILPGVPYIDNWHIRVVTGYLQALVEDRVPAKNLVINVPPGSMKSLLTCVLFPAWVWTIDQRKRFLCVTHSENFAQRDALLSRNLIKSDWYKSMFNVELKIDDAKKTAYSNTNGGFRHSYGLKGLTGDHGDFLIIDDPMDIEDRYSEAERKFVLDVYDNVLPSRVDPRNGKKVLIMQRIHEADLVGHIKRINERAQFVILPMEYEGEVFKPLKGLEDPRKKDGTLLWPEMFDQEYVADRKVLMSSMDVAGQYQQRPSPVAGNIFKKEWWISRRSSTDIIARFISWDTAAAVTESAAFSAGIVGEITANYKLYIREVVRGKWDFPQLQHQIEELATKYQFALKNIAIESKSSGLSVIQSLNASSGIIKHIENELQVSPQTLLRPVNPTSDKIARAMLITNFCEKGMVLLPPPDGSNKGWLSTFEDELFTFPNSAYMDQTDAFTQLVWFCSNYLEVGLSSWLATVR
jgi:predicted phage terminase large subunit-like protein